MLSKSQIKLIKSLAQKKFRNKHELFIVEGLKGVGEFVDSDFELVSLFTTGETFDISDDRLNFVEKSELKKITSLKTPQEVLAVFKIPRQNIVKTEGLVLALDGVRDPGNLGTIIRLCDWFGVENLICSLDTVDCYNPKVVQASMGSLARVNITYLDLHEYLKQQKEFPIYGTLLQGENIYESELKESAIVVMGNEANGISKEIESLIIDKITIPQFGKNQSAESLNVATATSIVLSEFKRNLPTGK